MLMPRLSAGRSRWSVIGGRLLGFAAGAAAGVGVESAFGAVPLPSCCAASGAAASVRRARVLRVRIVDSPGRSGVALDARWIQLAAAVADFRSRSKLTITS